MNTHNNNQPLTVKTIVMKVALAIALIASCSAIALATVSFKSPHAVAYNDGPTDNAEQPQSVFHWIKQVMHCPEYVGQQAMNVEIWLHVDEQGVIQVQRLKSEDEKLKEYVLEMLSNKSFNILQDEVNKDYHFTIRFQTI